MNAPIVQLSSLSKRYAGRSMLDRLDWAVAPGQVIGLLGRNGSGKSTLLGCLLGIVPIDGGAVRLFGTDAATMPAALRARIGYVPQTADLFGWQTPRQMLAYFAALYPHWNTARVTGLLARWGFTDAMLAGRIDKLSGGEKQKLSIIRALAPDPTLLILDEPVAALDPVARRAFLRELVDDVIERGTTVVFSTHILTDLERVAVDVAFLKDGKIALQGPLDTLLDGALRITGPAALMAPLIVPGELRRTVDAAGVTQVVTHSAGPALLATVGQQSALRIDRLSLEDLFVEVTQ
jgi:ABC-2 type transport system ATP-binding protein